MASNERKTPEWLLVDQLVAFGRARAISVIAELGVADQIAAGHTGLAELAAAVGADEQALSRVLRQLVSIDILTWDPTAGYGLTAQGELLRSDVPGSQHATAVMMGSDYMFQTWGQLAHSVRTGQDAFTAAHGKPLFDYLAEHPADNAGFDAAMAAQESVFTELAAAYPFTDGQHLIDLGGGRGTLLTEVLTAHPGLRGTVFDAPATAERGRGRLAAHPLAGRLDFQGGDLFEGVPAGGDVYLLSRILHDWTDEQCLTILRHCRSVMKEHARLLVLERVVPDDFSPGLAIDWDVRMLAITGGRERTSSEYRALFEQAGLVEADRLHLGGETDVLVARTA